jgi:hypothetical protein
MGFAYDRQHTGATSNGVDWEGLRPAADYGSNSAQQDQVAAQAAPGPTSWLEMSCPAGARVAQEGGEEAYAPGWARDEGETGEGASFAFGAGQVLAQGAPTASPVSPDHPDATKKLFAAQRFRRRLPGRVPELSAGPGACTARRLARGATPASSSCSPRTSMPSAGPTRAFWRSIANSTTPSRASAGGAGRRRSAAAQDAAAARSHGIGLCPGADGSQLHRARRAPSTGGAEADASVLRPQEARR